MIGMAEREQQRDRHRFRLAIAHRCGYARDLSSASVRTAPWSLLALARANHVIPRDERR
jgi:hypothetical protein